MKKISHINTEFALPVSFTTFSSGTVRLLYLLLPDSQICPTVRPFDILYLIHPGNHKLFSFPLSCTLSCTSVFLVLMFSFLFFLWGPNHSLFPLESGTSHLPTIFFLFCTSTLLSFPQSPHSPLQFPSVCHCTPTLFLMLSKITDYSLKYFCVPFLPCLEFLPYPSGFCFYEILEELQVSKHTLSDILQYPTYLHETDRYNTGSTGDMLFWNSSWPSRAL